MNILFTYYFAYYFAISTSITLTHTSKQQPAPSSVDLVAVLGLQLWIILVSEYFIDYGSFGSTFHQCVLVSCDRPTLWCVWHIIMQLYYYYRDMANSYHGGESSWYDIGTALVRMFIFFKIKTSVFICTLFMYVLKGLFDQINGVIQWSKLVHSRYLLHKTEHFKEAYPWW